MKVALRDIKPNPYRYLNKGYPIDKAKVEKLRSSIKRTGFWDNLVARRNKKGEIEIAYGHHRIEALRQEYPASHEISVILRDIDNEQMLKIMAAENDAMDIMSPGVINETVRAAMEFLHEEIAIYEANANRQPGKPAMVSAAQRDVLERAKKLRTSSIVLIISEFLDWPLKRITEAMSAIHAIDKKTINKEDYESLPNQYAAAAFRRESTKLNMTTGERKELLERIRENHLEGRDIRREALDIKFKGKKVDSTVMIDDLADTITAKLLDASVAMTDQFIKHADDISDESLNKLVVAVRGLIVKLKRVRTVLGKNRPLQIEEV